MSRKLKPLAPDRKPFIERVKEKPFSERVRRRDWKKDWHESYVFLGNKLNAKIFVENLGIRTPETYGVITGASDAHGITEFPPNLPSSWVLKPIRGANESGVIVCVDGIDQVRNKPVTKEHIQSVMKASPLRNKAGGNVYLVEEYIQNNLQYQVYTFRDHAEIIRTATSGGSKGTFYFKDWTEVSYPLTVNIIPGKYTSPKPSGLQELLNAAEILGKAYGTFVRIDFYMQEDQPVFGEFSWYPGSGKVFTSEAEGLLGDLWIKHLGPDVL